MIKILKDIKATKKEIKEYHKKLKIYEQFLKDPKKLSPQESFELEMNGFEEPEKPRFTTVPINFLILDDCLGSEAFRVGRSPFTQFCLSNRHYQTNVLILTQNLKGIPKSLRINCSLFVMFKFHNSKILEDLYEEVENVLTQQQFTAIYKYATDQPHGCLLIDFTGKKKGCLELV